MPIYQQIPIRLEASLVSNPPVPPIDLNTGISPKFWRAQDIAVSVGIFDAFGASVDLSNVAFLTLTIQTAPDSIVPLIAETINAGAGIIPTITRAGWINGMQQQATFLLSAAQTDLGLDGTNSKTFWMLLAGVTMAGDKLVYAAGYVTFYNPGSTLAIPPYGYVSRAESVNSSGNTAIVPGSFNHTHFVTINGAARTTQIILSIAQMEDGAVLRLYLNLPATANIIISVVNAAANGTQLSTITTGSVLNGLFTYCYSAALVTWQPINYSLPAT